MRAAALLAAFVLTTGAAFAQTPKRDVPVLAGSGQIVFGDVPVVPGSYPDTGPHPFAMRGAASVNSQSFDYGTKASPWNVLAWYHYRLIAGGWRVEKTTPNAPGPQMVTILATRRGEAVTIVVASDGNTSRISIVKFDTSK